MAELSHPRLVNTAIVRCANNSRDDADAIFRAFDVNDGHIAEEEFLLGCCVCPFSCLLSSFIFTHLPGFCILTDASPVESAHFLFDSIDTDNNGSIDKAELEFHMKGLVRMLLFPKVSTQLQNHAPPPETGVLTRSSSSPKVMDFEDRQGTAAALTQGGGATKKEFEEHLAAKGKLWLERKEQRLPQEVGTIWRAMRKDEEGRVGLHSWTEACMRVSGVSRSCRCRPCRTR